MRCLLLLLILTVLLLPLQARAGETIIDEEFDSLANWTPVLFPKISRHTTYEIEMTEAGSFLVARSDNSASAIRYIHEFEVYRFPVVRWRWKVDRVYDKGNVLEKSGDDYPLRVYVMFKYDPDRASFGDQVQYGLAKILYGAYPPHSSLNYIWASRPEEQGIHPSPYTDKAQLLIRRAGGKEAGRWVEEEINILDDFRKAFGTEPPALASIAIMNDSDNTGEASTSYMDYIQVREDK